MTSVADDFFELLSSEQHGKAEALLSTFTVSDSDAIYSQ